VTSIVAASRGDAAAVEEGNRTGPGATFVQVGYVEPMRLDPSPERIEALAGPGVKSQDVV